MADPIIALEGVTLRYPTAPNPTLRDIFFRVEPGEFVGIVGSTGSGKSSLLYLLAGVIPHYLRAEISGDVLIYGRRTQELSLARITERVGLVLQDPEAQLFNLLVRDACSCPSPKAHPLALKFPSPVRRYGTLNLAGAGEMVRPAFSDGRACTVRPDPQSTRGAGEAELGLLFAVGAREDGGGGLRRPAHVAMVQTPDFRD